MALALSGLSNVSYYLDDILVFTETEEQHVATLIQVFERLVLHGLELSPTKCKFMMRQVAFLGFLVTPEGLKPREEYVKPLLDTPTPQTLTDLKSLLGSFNFYRKFVNNFSSIAAPLI